MQMLRFNVAGVLYKGGLQCLWRSRSVMSVGGIRIAAVCRLCADISAKVLIYIRIYAYFGFLAMYPGVGSRVFD